MALNNVHQLCVMVRVHNAHIPFMSSLLVKHNIKPQQVTAMPFSDGEASQVLFIFSCPRAAHEIIMKELLEKGIGGLDSESDVTILPLALAKDVRARITKEEEGSDRTAEPTPDKSTNIFQSTIKARIAVENVHFDV